MKAPRRRRRRAHAGRRGGRHHAAGSRNAILATVVFLLAALGARAQYLPKPGDKWFAAGGPELTVVGQAPARRVEEIARELHLVRSALLSIVGAPDHAAPYPTLVVVFRDDAALLSYARGSDRADPRESLLAALDRQGRVAALSLESAPVGLTQMRATLAADLVDQLLATPPAWVPAGLSGLMARMEAAGRASDPPRLVERMSPPASDPAVGLVRHLAHPRSERSSQLRRYLTLLRGGAPDGAAFEESFFGSFDAISAEVAQVIARGGAPPIELDPQVPPLEPAREVPYDRVVLLLGDLLLRVSPWNTVAAEAHFRTVLEHRPSDPAALRGIAIVRELDDRPADAAELWQQSLAAAPADRLTPMLEGWSRLERFRRNAGARRGWEDPVPEPVAAARELFVQALAPASSAGAPAAASPSAADATEHAGHADHAAGTAATGHGARQHDVGPPIADDASPHALHGYGATFLFARNTWEPALAALERAAKLLPGDDQIAADLILLHAHVGNQNLAWELRRERLLDRVPAELDALVEKLLAEEALHQANRFLLVEQKPDSALALVRGAAAEVRNPATRGEIEGVLAQMEQVAAKLREEALYDRFFADVAEAKRLAGERRFDEARRLLEPYAAETMDPIVRDPARDILRQLDQVDRAPK